MSTNLTATSQRMARQLYDMLAHRRLLMRKVTTLKKWNDEFLRLLTRTPFTAQQIQTTLDWYCEHISDRYTPKCYSATTFRVNFERIHRAMQRYITAQEKDNLTAHTDKGAFIYKWLTERYEWKCTDTDLRDAIEVTLKSTSRLMERLTRLQATLSADQAHIARHLINQIYTADSFTLQWFDRFFVRTMNWDEWSKKFDGMLPLIGSKALRRELSPILNAYCGNDSFLDRLENL